MELELSDLVDELALWEARQIAAHLDMCDLEQDLQDLRAVYNDRYESLVARWRAKNDVWRAARERVAELSRDCERRIEA